MLLVQKFIRENPEQNIQYLYDYYGINFKYNEDKSLIIIDYDQIRSTSHKDNDIVRECRGLVLYTLNWDIVAHSFKRFFNYGEQKDTEIFDWKNFNSTEKIDGCISFDSILETDKGYKTIEEILKTPEIYEILTYNHEKNCQEFSKIEDFSIKENNNNWYKIELEDNTILKLTGNHKIWCENLGLYKRVDELNGTEILLKK